ncbi:MAG TPA: hypothetical protein VII94_02315 [Candidatus Saccharimonadales bacterium]
MFKKVVKYIKEGWTEGNLSIQLIVVGSIALALYVHYRRHRAGYFTISPDNGPPVSVYFLLIALCSVIGLIYQLYQLRKILKENNDGNDYKQIKTEDDKWFVCVESTEFREMTGNLRIILKFFYVAMWAGIIWLILK